MTSPAGAVEPNLILHTAARRYLVDRRREWIDAYTRVPNEGRASDGYHYRDDAKDIFPRYNVLDAILVEIERLDPEDLPSVEVVRDQLVNAGYHADDMFTSGKAGAIEGRAMEDERALFLLWVDAAAERLPESVQPLPYRRTLAPEESTRWRNEVESRWPIEHGGWWEPISSSAPDDAVVLDAASFWDDHDDGPATIAVRRALEALGVRRVIELREYGPEYEVALDALSPTYTGAEGTFTSEGAEWLIFASHEGMTAIGGTLVEPLKTVWRSWADAVWREWQ